jgi:hypothetical protein
MKRERSPRLLPWMRGQDDHLRSPGSMADWSHVRGSELQAARYVSAEASLTAEGADVGVGIAGDWQHLLAFNGGLYACSEGGGTGDLGFRCSGGGGGRWGKG